MPLPEATLEEQEEVFELPQEVSWGCSSRVQGLAFRCKIDTFAFFCVSYDFIASGFGDRWARTLLGGTSV